MKIRFTILLSLFILIGCGTKGKKIAPEPADFDANREILAENFVSDGIDFYKAKKYDEAIQRWKEALRLIPTDHELYNFLGLAYHKTADLDSAIIYFKNASFLDSAYYEAWNNVGFMYFLKGEYKSALKYFDESIHANVFYEQAHLNRKIALDILLGRISRTAYELVENASAIDSLEYQIESYRKALTLNPNYVDAWNNLGVAYFYYGLTDSAVICIKKALDLNPDYAAAHNNAGYILSAGKHFDEAISHFSRALEIEPNYLAALTNMLDTFYEKGDYTATKKILLRLINDFPKKSLVKLRQKEYQHILNNEQAQEEIE